MAKGGFRGGYGGGKSQSNMIKQAQKMQEELLKMQQELENQTYRADSGGGAVTAVVSGKHRLEELTISVDAIDPDDPEMLQDLIIGAVNEALRKADEASSQSMSKFNLPGLF